MNDETRRGQALGAMQKCAELAEFAVKHLREVGADDEVRDAVNLVGMSACAAANAITAHRKLCGDYVPKRQPSQHR
jgi:hypothetical protein